MVGSAERGPCLVLVCCVLVEGDTLRVVVVVVEGSTLRMSLVVGGIVPSVVLLEGSTLRTDFVGVGVVDGWGRRSGAERPRSPPDQIQPRLGSVRGLVRVLLCRLVLVASRLDVPLGGGGGCAGRGIRCVVREGPRTNLRELFLELRPKNFSRAMSRDRDTARIIRVLRAARGASRPAVRDSGPRLQGPCILHGVPM